MEVANGSYFFIFEFLENQSERVSNYRRKGGLKRVGEE